MRSSARKLGEPPTSAMASANTTPKTEATPTRSKSKGGTGQQQAQSATPKNKPAPQPTYKVGDKVLCLHKGSTIYYEAKIQSETEIDGEKAFNVHYQGWNNRYDESVTVSEIPTRFKVHTPEAVAEAKQAQKDASGASSKKSRSRSSAVDASKLSNTPSGTAASSRSSTPFESGKRRQTRDSSLIESGGGKRSRQSGKQETSLASLVPPSQVGLIGQSVSSALAQQQINQPAKKSADIFLEAFPKTFCDILRSDHENILKGKMPVVPARITIEDIVGDYKESLGQNESNMRVEYGPADSLEQTTPACLALCADGLIDCFNNFVRTDLLYKSEWEAHDKKFKPLSEKGGKNGADSNSNLPHTHYGTIHLVRLFSKSVTLMERLQLQRDIRYASQANVQDFMAFVNKSLKKYLNPEEDYK